MMVPMTDLEFELCLGVVEYIDYFTATLLNDVLHT
jgi:hypothetical protein